MYLNKVWIAVILWVLVTITSFIQAEEKFSLGQVIHPRVLEMRYPQQYQGIAGAEMVLSSSSEKACDHVRQGFAMVHAQWDFEAYRHFSAALQEDPDCLMAYAGVIFSLARPHSEYNDYKNAALARILDLIEVDEAGVKKGELERFPKIEKKFAVAAVTMVSASPYEAGKLFRQVGEEFPNYRDAILMGIFLSRGSYDINGFASPEQKLALQKTLEILKNRADDVNVHSFLVSMLAQAPPQHRDLRNHALSSARFLVKTYPQVPSWQHSLGHYYYRSGNYPEAEKAFSNAVQLYENWMEEYQVSRSDAEGYIKSMCYLADTLYQRGDFDSAMKVAMKLRSMEIDLKRFSSPANQLLLWRGYILPAQLYIARGLVGDMDLAHQSLPDRDELRPLLEGKENPSFIGLYVEALATYIGSRKALGDGVLHAALVLHRDVLSKNIANLSKVAEVAQRSGEASYYYDAVRCISIYDMELSGLIAVHGDAGAQIVAPNWYRSAIDRQGVAPLMLSPSVLTPMENRLGEYYLQTKEYKKSYESYNKALKRRPNNMESLMGAKKALGYLDNEAFSRIIQKQIDRLKR